MERQRKGVSLQPGIGWYQAGVRALAGVTAEHREGRGTALGELPVTLRSAEELDKQGCWDIGRIQSGHLQVTTSGSQVTVGLWPEKQRIAFPCWLQVFVYSGPMIHEFVEGTGERRKNQRSPGPWGRICERSLLLWITEETHFSGQGL